MAAGTSGYFIITVTTAAAATNGNTVKLDGVVNPVIFSFITSPTITNNQTDAAGTQTLALAPFIDTGLVWTQANNPDTQFPSQNFLAGIGLGVIWQPTSQWNIRVDYGLPLVNLQDRGTNIQDSGFYFSLNYKL